MKNQDILTVSLFYIKLYKNTADLIITIKQIPHNKYKRNKSDLLYTYNINLADTFKCKNIEILTLDGRKQSIFIDEIIT